MKPWAHEIEQHIQTWSAQLGNLHWWPKFVYHFTDIQNAAQILKRGYLYSRATVEKLGLMQNDNASPQIIQQTAPEHFDFVRCYFRPQTPTQFQNEGIRPRNQRELGGAHCPVPIFFCFDAMVVLSMDESYFSNGNMGSVRAQYSDKREFFLNIPFAQVFHNRRFTDEERNDIIFHRHAEVLIRDQLTIEPILRFIACRSMAERQTLLHLLPIGLANQWAPKIRIASANIFERRWTYVEEVVVVDRRVTFRFNPETRTPGSFEVIFTYQENGSDEIRTWQGVKTSLNRELSFNFQKAVQRWGIASLYLDDALAFQGLLVFEKIPF